MLAGLAKRYRAAVVAFRLPTAAHRQKINRHHELFETESFGKFSHELTLGTKEFSLSLSRHILTMENHKNENVVVFFPSFYLIFTAMGYASARSKNIDMSSLYLKPSFKQALDDFLEEGNEKLKLVMPKADKNGDEVAEEELESLLGQFLTPKHLDLESIIRQFLTPKYFHLATKYLTEIANLQVVWKNMFKESETIFSDFHLLNGSSVKVPFMTSKRKQMISVHDGFKVLKLPFQDLTSLYMYMFVPDAKDGLRSLVDTLTKNGFKFLESHNPLEPVKVGRFKIPKFKFSSEFEVSKILKELGIPMDMMKDCYEAKELFDSDMFLKSWIGIGENGMGAAAGAVEANAGVVAGAGGVFSMESRKNVRYGVDFVADHPFLFLIRNDENGMMSFIGQVFNPLKH